MTWRAGNFVVPGGRSPPELQGEDDFEVYEDCEGADTAPLPAAAAAAGGALRPSFHGAFGAARLSPIDDVSERGEGSTINTPLSAMPRFSGHGPLTVPRAGGATAPRPTPTSTRSTPGAAPATDALTLAAARTPAAAAGTPTAAARTLAAAAAAAAAARTPAAAAAATPVRTPTVATPASVFRPTSATRALAVATPASARRPTPAPPASPASTTTPPAAAAAAAAATVIAIDPFDPAVIDAHLAAVEPPLATYPGVFIHAGAQPLAHLRAAAKAGYT